MGKMTCLRLTALPLPLREEGPSDWITDGKIRIKLSEPVFVAIDKISL